MRTKATREQIAEVERLFPITNSQELADKMGISLYKLQYIARSHGIYKTHEYMSRIRTESMRAAYERDKDTERGKHWFKKGYDFRERFGDKADEIISKASEGLKRARRSDRRRVLFGLPQKYKFKIASGGRKRVHQRYRLRKYGYHIDKGSNVCYYDENTKRNLALEAKYFGLRFEPKEV